MSMDGFAAVYNYGPGTGDVPEDDTVAGLAQSLDATIDAAGAALAAGDVGQAAALVGAADTVSDALLEALGAPDADDPAVA